MKKIFYFVLLSLFIGCINEDSNNATEQQKIGKFAVQKIDTANNSIKRSISEMNGGTINASTDSFFILKNVGTANITDIKIYSLYAKTSYTPSDSSPDTDFITEAGEINSTNFETAEAAFAVNPGALSVIEPYSEVSTIPLIKISISHGDNANGIGLASLLPQGENKAYIIITGTSNGVKLQENIEFSTIVNVAKWQIIYDSVSENAVDKVAPYSLLLGYLIPNDALNVRLQNIGSTTFTYGLKKIINNGISIIDTSYYYSDIEKDSSEIINQTTLSSIGSDEYIIFSELFLNTKGVIYDFRTFNYSLNSVEAIDIKIFKKR